jgi:uncharacterized RDD family membrane protein YckC
MIWVAVVVLGFFVYAGARLLVGSRPGKPSVVIGDLAPSTSTAGHLPTETGVELVLAARWRRAVARLIDGLVLAGISYLMAFIAYVVFVRSAVEDATVNAGVARARWLTVALGLVAWAVYDIALTSASGRTPGKRAMKVGVVSIETGKPPSAESALFRWLPGALLGAVVPILTTRGIAQGGIPHGRAADLAWVAFGVVYSWAFLDRGRQGLHDKTAGTIVVERA